MAKWDRGVGFEEALRMLAAYKNWLRGAPAPTLKRRLALRNVNILLLALANGLRISEAVECHNRWLENPHQKEILVKAAKTKKERYKLCRTDPLDTTDHQLTADLPKPTPNTIQTWALKRLGINTHTLKTAHTRHLARQTHTKTAAAKPLPPTTLKTLTTHTAHQETIQAILRELQKPPNNPS
jgi:integrase